MSDSIMTPPTASQKEALALDVIEYAQSIPAKKPTQDSVLGFFIPAYKQVKDKVDTQATKLASCQFSGKHTWFPWYLRHF